MGISSHVSSRSPHRCLIRLSTKQNHRVFLALSLFLSFFPPQRTLLDSAGHLLRAVWAWHSVIDPLAPWMYCDFVVRRGERILSSGFIKSCHALGSLWGLHLLHKAASEEPDIHLHVIIVFVEH